MTPCTVTNSYGYPCNRPSGYVVYLEPEDGTAVCGKHLVSLVKHRLSRSEVEFIKVCLLDV